MRRTKSFFFLPGDPAYILDYEPLNGITSLFELRNRIRAEDQVSWDGVGILRKDVRVMYYSSRSGSGLFSATSPAVRVNRQDAHTLFLWVTGRGPAVK